jgi:hypothetical protein
MFERDENNGTVLMFILLSGNLDWVYKEQRCNFCRVLTSEYGGIRSQYIAVSIFTRLQDRQTFSKTPRLALVPSQSPVQ